MKKTVLAWAVLLITGLSSAFANKGGDINQGVFASFNRDFGAARNVSWQEEKQFAKATFTLNDQVMFAYYSKENHELLAVIRNILSSQLPINLFTGLKKDYSGYWISDLFELAKPEGTSYYATLESSEETIILRASSANEWTVYRRTRKQ